MTELSPGRPAPEHIRVYFCAVFPWSITVAEPDVANEPDHAPLAAQDVAFELDQTTVALWPGMTALGLMEMDAVALGGGGVYVGELPPLQPDRTIADTRRTTTTGESSLPVYVGTCISPPFA